MLTYFVSLVHVAAMLNALTRSAQQRFFAGVLGAILRIGLVVAQLTLTWGRAAPMMSFFGPARETTDAAPNAMLGLLVAIGGPFLSLAMFLFAHARAKDAPAEEEKRAARPANAWLIVLLLDGAFLVIAVAAALFVAD